MNKINKLPINDWNFVSIMNTSTCIGKQINSRLGYSPDGLVSMGYTHDEIAFLVDKAETILFPPDETEDEYGIPQYIYEI